ncbi:competence type IV pilus minor pilin ComGD [Streptococcus cameli]
MLNTQTKLLRLHLKAFTLLEALITLSVLSFLTLSLSGGVKTAFRQAEEAIFFMSFEQVYKDSQQLAVASHQPVTLTISEQAVDNGYLSIAVPSSILVETPVQLHFAADGGNSSLAKLRFQTETQEVSYQLYLGSGRYKKSNR